LQKASPRAASPDFIWDRAVGLKAFHCMCIRTVAAGLLWLIT